MTDIESLANELEKYIQSCLAPGFVPSSAEFRHGVKFGLSVALEMAEKRIPGRLERKPKKEEWLG